MASKEAVAKIMQRKKGTYDNGTINGMTEESF